LIKTIARGISMKNTYTDICEFMPDEEVATRIIDGKQYIVKAVFSGTTDIKSAVLRLAEHKTMREMGIDVPLEFERDNAS
jgi:hypothetical protein